MIKNNEGVIEVTLTKEDIEYCEQHAALMCQGAKTYSFKEGKNQSHDVYSIGKIGELAFLKYLESVGANVIHKPFRDDYSKFNWSDDFIIETRGVKVQIEVRTKGRNVDPKPTYECCTDCIKPHLVYVFISYNRQTMTAFIVGKANWGVLSKNAYVSLKGSANNNFKHKVNEFNIEIKDLTPMR